MADDSRTETPVETVERLAALARIALPEERKEALAAEFEQVLAYIAQLDHLTLAQDGTPPLPPLHNVFREDANAYESGTWTEHIVDAFPAKAGDALTVKKIIAHD